MTIYVDEIKDYGQKGKRCHMATDGSPEELHQFADNIWVKREWFQDHPLHPHYDLNPEFRRKAVLNGAVEVTSRELVMKCSKLFKKEDGVPVFVIKYPGWASSMVVKTLDEVMGVIRDQIEGEAEPGLFWDFDIAMELMPQSELDGLEEFTG